MKYSCTILTPESYKARQEWIEEFIAEELGDDPRKGYKRIFLHLEYTGFLNRIDETYELAHLIPSNILKPETYVKDFESKEHGYQSQPRIMWDGEIVKIDDIDEIIGFKRVREPVTNTHYVDVLHEAGIAPLNED